MESRLDDNRDVFEMFEAAHGAGVVVDPYPRWAELRRERAVHEGDLFSIFQAGAPSIFGDRPVFTVLGYDAVAEVLRDSDRFCTEIFNDVMGPVLGRVILGMAPESTIDCIEVSCKRRSVVGRCSEWTPHVIEPVVDEHVASFEESRARRSRQRPHVLVPRIRHRRDARTSRGGSAEVPPMGSRDDHACRSIRSSASPDRRSSPSTSRRSSLGGPIRKTTSSPSSTRRRSRAGRSTTRRSSTSCVSCSRRGRDDLPLVVELCLGLLSQPEVLDEVRTNRELLPQAIEEALRWEPPLTMIFRGAARDTELAGVRIPEGAVVAVNVGAANRDETSLGEPGGLRHPSPPARAPRVRLRAAHLSRHAPGPRGDDRCHERGAGSSPQPPPRSCCRRRSASRGARSVRPSRFRCSSTPTERGRIET